MPEANFATNLRRLLLFEHRSGKEAAAALGVTDASVSRWLTGRRYPNAPALIAIERLYGVSPRALDGDPVEFAQVLADPERIKYAESMREHADRGELTPEAAVEASRRAQAARDSARVRSKVVPIRRGAKKK
jgi:transcriptional regulator with XRE-family HTH domain